MACIYDGGDRHRAKKYNFQNKLQQLTRTFLHFVSLRSQSYRLVEGVPHMSINWKYLVTGISSPSMVLRG